VNEKKKLRLLLETNHGEGIRSFIFFCIIDLQLFQNNNGDV
jgi:hypothetical protein